MVNGDSSKPQEGSYNITVRNPYVPAGVYRDQIRTPLVGLFRYLNRMEKEDLLYKKLMLEDGDANESAYIQSACELTICSWFAQVAHSSGGRFVYEYKVSPPKDVDCTIWSNGKQFNIEVKCGDYSQQKKIEADSDVVTHTLGRLDDYDDLVHLLQSMSGGSATPPVLLAAQHMDCKLKDYLLSAQSKFGGQVAPDSLNVLFVCVDDQMDMIKWVNYLMGPRGLFTEESFEPIEHYSNVDLVVFTNLYHRHSHLRRKTRIERHWDLGQAFNYAVINPSSSKRAELFTEFSRLVPLENGAIERFLKESNDLQPYELALGLSIYVVEQSSRGIHKFQGYAPD